MNLDALFSMNCGMYVLCSGDAGRYNGLIINAVVQVTAFPNQVIASVNKESLTCTLVQKSGHFTLSVLDKEAPLQLIGLFGFRTGKNFDKMTQVQYFLGKNGMPVINEHTVAYLEAKVISQLDAGTHILLLGEITECDYLNKAEP
ncbi:MAG: flavin reductase family protein, partial [Atribacterota bacterium]